MVKGTTQRKALTTLIGCVAACTVGLRSAPADVTITLDNAFIQKYKHRATISTIFTVDKAHKNVNPPSKDGDMHIAGRADEVRLPIVAEIMNAKLETAAVKRIHQLEGSGTTVAMTGAWRLWCEHGGDSKQIQGEELQPFKTTNPDHVFEIHPITRLGSSSLLKSLRPIAGYKTKDATNAITSYEKTRFEIKPGPTQTTLVTSMGGYNYVEFVMVALTDQQFVVDDGRMIFASIYDPDGHMLVRKRRMVFVKGSAPEKLARTLKKGQGLQVVGVPRINLALVDWRVREASNPNGEFGEQVLKWDLPYELIIVAVSKKIPGPFDE